MRSLVKILIASTALLIPMVQVCAAQTADDVTGAEQGHYNYEQQYYGDQSDTQTQQYPYSNSGSGYGSSSQGNATIVNGQMNFNTVWSTNNLTVTNVNGDAIGAASAVGNTAQILTMQDSYVTNKQVDTGNIGSMMYANVNGVNGSAQFTSTSLCNGASVSTDPNITQIHSSQSCNASDPVATTNAEVGNVSGSVVLGAMSIGNQFEADSNATHFPVTNIQSNSAGTFANVNATAFNIGGGIQSTATAVGNTAQIIHYTTGN